MVELSFLVSWEIQDSVFKNKWLNFWQLFYFSLWFFCLKWFWTFFKCWRWREYIGTFFYQINRWIVFCHLNNNILHTKDRVSWVFQRKKRIVIIWQWFPWVLLHYIGRCDHWGCLFDVIWRLFGWLCDRFLTSRVLGWLGRWAFCWDTDRDRFLLFRRWGRGIISRFTWWDRRRRSFCYRWILFLRVFRWFRFWIPMRLLLM